MKTTILAAAALLAAALTSCHSTSGDSLQHDLEAYIATCDAEIGVAVITDRGDTICVNNDRHYPMNSVVKLYQAMAVAATLEQRGTPLDTVITIARDELHQATYSPIRDNCPGDTLRLTVAQLLEYSLQLSDNNAFDIMADRIVDLPATRHHIGTLGISGFDIMAYEKEMFDDHDLTNANRNHPLSAAMLINALFTKQLYAADYQNFLKHTLVSCETGANRLASPLKATGATIGHKTGTGFTAPDGTAQGTNDVGFVTLPNGRSYAIAVFVRTSSADLPSTERIIARLSEITLNHMQQHP